MTSYTVIRDDKVYRVHGERNEAGELIETFTEVASFPVECNRCGWRTIQVGSRNAVELCSCGGELFSTELPKVKEAI
jgi:hypothetical protein